MSTQPKIIVLDDDPTGSQTVHSCLLLMQWDVETLRFGLTDDSPIVFILTNTRALTPEEARQVTVEVCQNLKQAIAAEKIENFLVVSRSDSTLRGHYPIETDAIAAELGPFDGHFLIPAFFEGGRITRDSIHYLMVDGTPTPVHETEFAKDSVFGYSHSYLPDYVAQKTQGQISSDRVQRFLLEDIREGSFDRLMTLTDNQCGVVDAEHQVDLDWFAGDLLRASSHGKRFLLRSAASILTSLAQLPQQPVMAEHMNQYVREGQPGVILVGSHVKKTTEQLTELLKEPEIKGIEVDVSTLLKNDPNSQESLIQSILSQVQDIHSQGRTPVIYTSRQELTFPTIQARLDFGKQVSQVLMTVVENLPEDMGYLISKGGITSNDVLSHGLRLRSARLLGQILPGCSLVRTPIDHPRFPNLPVVLFPGNVGDRHGLTTVYQRLNQQSAH
ncbi:four-carbon acid sugar kinase family protein [Roseofilum capinflatum]|uniref:Four-carbon acid sugar kinase family protein n=1 Tax=Roseofilum capinflatum BLCC-M114 TaxID=3022440 RepID=A0ABT7B4P8_9CYAN|nr:four-carbon acid sugar kinase family protein [Roseofilum capinflatum]MDJ1174151.1 four-carbon acid sugar kinase family protein [Roseofilum capinflatum BLCC-M114]